MAKPKVTVREAKLVQGVVAGKTKRQAAKDAGYGGSPETLSVRASSVIKKSNVQDYYAELMAKHEITVERALKPISKALDAKKTVVTGDGDNASYNEVDDLDMQLKGSDRALKLLGVSAPENTTTNYNFINVAKGDKVEFGV
jgi:phage terminase small subunit